MKSMILQQVCARQKGSSIQNNTTQLTIIRIQSNWMQKIDQDTEEFQQQQKTNRCAALR